MIFRFDVVRRRARAGIFALAAVGLLVLGGTGCSRSSNGGGPEVLPKRWPGQTPGGGQDAGTARKPLPPGAGAGGVMGGGPGGRRLPPGGPNGAR